MHNLKNMIPQIINDNDETRDIQISNGETVTLKIDDYENTVTALNSSNQEIGSLEFSYDEDFDKHKLKWMHLDKLGDKYKRMGIGTAAILFYKDFFNCLVYAEYNDGIQKDDGSHLTQDAPVFVDKLRNQGIIES
jgi:hypothetical protein